MRPERLYLTDIVEASEAIAEFIAGLNEASFYQDSKTQSAVLQKLIVIGEAPPGYLKIFEHSIPKLNGEILSLSVTSWFMPTFPSTWK